MKLWTWQMNILISITGVFKWNAFISPYLRAHVFLFLIPLKKPFLLSWYLGPNKNSGDQLRTLLQPTPALVFTRAEGTSRDAAKWKFGFTVRAERGKKTKPCIYPKGLKWQRSHHFGQQKSVAIAATTPPASANPGSSRGRRSGLRAWALFWNLRPGSVAVSKAAF